MSPIRNDGPKRPAAPAQSSKSEKAQKQEPAKKASAPAAKAAASTTPRASGLDSPRTAAPIDLSGRGPAAAPGTLAAAFDSIPAPGGPTEARVLSNGLDSWNARWDMLKGATKTIDASYFILEKDAFGYAFLGGLLKKQLEGVQVRVMTDSMADPKGDTGFTMAGRGKDYLQELVEHGAESYVYNPLWKRPFEFLGGGYAALSSNHDKILVADGKEGITGGRNISKDYFADPRDLAGAWRDMDVKLEGTGVAGGLTAAFDAEVGSGAAQKVGKELFGNWDKKDVELLGAYELMDLWLNDPKLSDAEKVQLRADPAARTKLAEGLLERALQRLPGDLPAKLRREPKEDEVEMLRGLANQLVGHLEARGSAKTALLPERATEAKIIDQTSAAAGRVNGMAPALMALVDGAKKRIVIENPYVVLTEDMMQGLERASARGVQIDILTNSPLSTDSDVTQAFFLEDWPTILQRCPTANIYVATGERKFHTKSAVVDGEDALISTYNLDLLSWYVNSEVGAVVKSKELATDLLGEFDKDKADPKNGFIQYTIKRDADGKAVLENGKPVVEFGPENHLPKDVLEKYAKKRELWGEKLRDNVPWLKPLRH